MILPGRVIRREPLKHHCVVDGALIRFRRRTAEKVTLTKQFAEQGNAPLRLGRLAAQKICN
jgi:hypothetical protein